jgi:mono/diheme cytochrome c family protein
MEDTMAAHAAIRWLLAGAILTACSEPTDTSAPPTLAQGGVPAEMAAGRTIFRFDTFGNETFWTDTLRMHEVISASVSPAVALQVGLKVDVEALPPAVRAGLLAGTVDLNDPATTVALLSLGAVVGLVGEVDAQGTLLRVGTTCALCHSTVDNSFAPGIGRRLDGWPNLDLNPGAIIALSPALSDAQRAVYASWGPGRYDPRFNLDGINGPVIIPPAYGLKGVHRSTYTGDGNDLAYWNRYVAVTQMHGHGSFDEPRTGVSVSNPPDLVSAKLPALQAYQLGLQAPQPADGSFDRAAAGRGRAVFVGAARCATCHSGATLSDANQRLHPPSEVVSEPEPGGVPSYAGRSATKLYRTTPLRALALRGPYFHNGVAATLAEVVERYNSRMGLNLSPSQKSDLVEYLRSL